jgi:serine protease AprX
MRDFAAGRFGLAALLVVLGLVPAAAAPHRARLSADLAEDLAAGSPVIDVIVHGSRPEVDTLARRYNLRVRRYLRSGGVFRLTAGQLDALSQDEDVEHLSSDLPIRSTAAVAAATIGADWIWAGTAGVGPFTGAGVGVAIIDSGIDSRHPALRARVAVSVDFTGGDGMDAFGHGTHVAGLIAGEAGRSPDTAMYRGMASGAHLINLRVLDGQGAGVASSVVEAIDWAIEYRRAYNIRVINLSLGGPVLQPYRDDPMCEAVERAVAAGLIVVVAAGNGGQTADGRLLYGGITTPGNDPHVITVGALDTRGTPDRGDDQVAPFSSKGPTRYDLVIKPDVVAPGSQVISAAAAGSVLAAPGGPTLPVSGYLSLSGTSMATGVVSGAVALLLEGTPGLSPLQAKTVLQLTSSFLTAQGLLGGGAGSINAVQAASLAASGLQSSPQMRRYIALGVAPLSLAFSTQCVEQSIETLNSTLSLDSIVWGNTSRVLDAIESIIWGNNLSTGSLAAFDSIVWGNSTDAIVWGNGSPVFHLERAFDSIVWGNSPATGDVARFPTPETQSVQLCSSNRTTPQ